jgi:hypothetical protein
MKRLITHILILAAIFVTAIAMAGSVYDRSVVSLGSTSGSAVWTNTAKYAAIKLVNIWIANDLVATDTQTIRRVTSGGSYTQAVGTISVATSAGNTTSFTAGYCKYGDMLTFTNTSATGAVAIIEYEVQEH